MRCLLGRKSKEETKEKKTKKKSKYNLISKTKKMIIVSMTN